MKKVIWTMLLSMFLVSWVAWEYNLDKEYNADEVNTRATYTTTSTELNNDNRICTMQYEPVCWADWQTYGNACMADFNYVHPGQCSEFVNLISYQNYQEFDNRFTSVIEDANESTVENAIETLNEWIEATKRSRIAFWAQRERITMYTYLRDLMQNVLNTSN